MIRSPIKTGDCILSWRIAARCDVCGKLPRPVHAPEEIHGFYCSIHCPVCSEKARRALLRKREGATAEVAA